MTREQYAPRRWDDANKRGGLLGAYIIGLLGAAVVIAGGLIAANQGGWLGHVQTQLNKVELPDLPNIPRPDLSNVLGAITDDVKNIRDVTAVNFQHQSAQLKGLGGESHPNVPGKKN